MTINPIVRGVQKAHICGSEGVNTASITRNFLNSTQPKDHSLRDFLETVLIYSPWATNESQNCGARFDVVAQSWSIFQGCIRNIFYYTAVYVHIWQPDSGLTLSSIMRTYLCFF